MNESACNDQDEQEIVKSFNFDDFTGKELLTDVRKSGLYSVVKIDEKVLDMLKEKDIIIASKQRLIVNEDKWLEKCELTIEELKRKVDQRQNNWAETVVYIEVLDNRDMCYYLSPLCDVYPEWWFTLISAQSVTLSNCFRLFLPNNSN